MQRATVAVAITALSLAAAPARAEAPGAFELLDKVRRAYAAATSYRDLGEIETTTDDAKDSETSLLFFETAAGDGGRFLWRTHGETPRGFEERVVWRDGDGAFVYSSLLGQYKPIPSIAAEVAHGFGRGGYDALLVPLLLAGAGEALEEPEAAAVGGPEPCGDATCWVVDVARMGSAVESRLWVDQATSLIREVEVRLDAGGGSKTIRVRHHAGPGGDAAYAVPDGARKVADWESGPPTEAEPEDPWVDLGFAEEITVSLFTLAARIVDRRGEPILGLEPDDLTVRIGDREVPVLALDWSGSTPTPEIPPAELAQARQMTRSGALSTDSVPPPPSGKLVVFFLQVDLQPTRITGHLKILPDVEELLGSLAPEDRVAVLSFDSHLKLWLDFSRDRDAVLPALEQALGHGPPSRRGHAPASTARRGGQPSLAEYLDERAAKAAASPEQALRVTADSLVPLAGDKDLIYLGWGLGRYGAGGVTMTADYGSAVRALDAARATVFVLDVTQAERHSLEVGLQSVARHTGGTYSRTAQFSTQAVRRLARTLRGHYLVTIDLSARPAARGRLAITLRELPGQVLFKPTILG